jgi:hypothetical protein
MASRNASRPQQVDITFQYPPELFNLLVDTIPRLNRSKKDLFLFFQGAGVGQDYVGEARGRWERAASSINKYDIVRSILEKLNAVGEPALWERREILKRVTEFDNFTTCWESDRLEAQGLVSQIRDVINVKDSFTRMRQEAERERGELIKQRQRSNEKRDRLNAELGEIHDLLSELTVAEDPWKRGIKFEDVANRLFGAFGVSVRESFRRIGDSGEGVVEQIDGVVEIDGEYYLVEMKWLKRPVSIDDVSRHLVRVYGRGSVRGLFVSATEFTEPAKAECRNALAQKVVTLATVEELLALLRDRRDLVAFVKNKVEAAIVDKNPFLKIMK